MSKPKLSEVAEFIVETFNSSLSSTHGNIWFQQAPETEEYDFVTYGLVGDIPTRDFCNDYAEYNIQFNIFCNPIDVYNRIDALKDTYNNLTASLSTTKISDFQNSNTLVLPPIDNTPTSHGVVTYFVKAAAK